MSILLHSTDPDLLYAAIGFTAQRTGFDPRLIEKDYFCSVVLDQLASQETGLVFKGGTCLAKVHDRFFRLSEDLDFTISAAPEMTRAERKRAVSAAKAVVASLPSALPGFRVREPLTGANVSTQYNGCLEYSSLLDNHAEPVRIEISVSEPTLRPTERARAATAVLNPVSEEPLIEPFNIESLSLQETMAEKLRAALCRSTPAIRDYFDVDHAVSAGLLDPADETLINLLRLKLAAPRTGPVDVSEMRIQELQRQLETQLRPMLRDQDFASFNFQRAVDTVRTVADLLGQRGQKGG